MFQTGHPFFPFPMLTLFQPETAWRAAARAFSPERAELPHIPRYVPHGQPAPVTPAAPKVSRPPVTKKSQPRASRGQHKCAWPGCANKVGPKATYCTKCRKRAQRARDKKNGVSR